MNQSRFVESNQSGIHPDLEWAVSRHLKHPTRRPVADHTRQAFTEVMSWFHSQGKPLIFDTGCGTGQSSMILARQFPDHVVIGVDKSEMRLQKAQDLPSNCKIIRAELQDFWMLLVEEKITCARQYLLYPNPWPKAHDFMRRWHGHPVFPLILQAGGQIELRTNWEIYAQEFAFACAVATGKKEDPKEFYPDPENPLTAFEKKYLTSGHRFWRYSTPLSA